VFTQFFLIPPGREISRPSFGKKGYRDNIFVERFWRTYKYECLHLQDISSPKDVKELSRKWVEYYNGERLHQAPGYRTPDEVFYGQERLTMSDKMVVQN